jgi:hypothetical protein
MTPKTRTRTTQPPPRDDREADERAAEWLRKVLDRGEAAASAPRAAAPAGGDKEDVTR